MLLRKSSLRTASQKSSSFSNIFFYLHRPLGAPSNLHRLTIHDSSAAFWALPVSLENLVPKLQNLSHDSILELAGSCQGWKQLHDQDWKRILQALHVTTISFHSGIHKRQMERLLSQKRIRSVHLWYDNVTSFCLLKNIQELHLHHGGQLDESQTTDLVQHIRLNLPHLQILQFHETTIAQTQLLLPLEDCSYLEHIHYPQTDPILDFLHVLTAAHGMRRTHQQQSRIQRKNSNHVINIDQVVHVWHEWWRATHRPSVENANANTTDDSRASNDSSSSVSSSSETVPKSTTTSTTDPILLLS